MGAQADNGSGTNFTPPFPSYDSGHATFGAAFFQVLRDFYGTDNISFSFQSDEYNGVTQDANGDVRPAVTRHYDNLMQAQQENLISRVYLGVHWIFDQEQGDMMGTNVGNYVFEHIMRPQRGTGVKGGGDSGTLTALTVGTNAATPVVGFVTPARLSLSPVPTVATAAARNLLVPPAASEGISATSGAATLTQAAGSGSLALTPVDAIELSMSLPGLFS